MRFAIGRRPGALALAIWWWMGAAAAHAQYPAALLDSIFPPGGKAGSTFPAALAGENLEELETIHFSHAGIRARPVDGGQPDPFDPAPRKFEVVIAPDVPPGVYEARAVGKYGISNPRAFSVSDRPEITAQNNRSPEQAVVAPLGSIVNGRTDKESVDYYRFAAKAGDRVLIEAIGQRIDSRADLSLVLLDGDGSELARNNDFYDRDPLVDFTVPDDGEYVVGVHDFLYQGGDEYFYRLSISDGPAIDYVFPPAGLAGTTQQYAVYGRNLPGGKPAEPPHDGQALERIDLEIALPEKPGPGRVAPRGASPSEGTLDVFVYQWPTDGKAAASVPIGFATAPVVIEAEENDASQTAQQVSPPCEIAGRFQDPGDQDCFQFEAGKGEEYIIDVLAERIGSRADPILRVERISNDKNGKEQTTVLKEIDDPPPPPRTPLRPTFDFTSGDPSYRLTVPADGRYRVVLRDVFGSSRGSPRDIYRLSIRQRAPDFRLFAVAELPLTDDPVQRNRGRMYSPAMAPGGTLGISVAVAREDGFDGEVVVSAEGLPTGVSASPLTIGPSAERGMLVLNAADDAPDYSGPISIVGQAEVGNKTVRREAIGASLVWPVANFRFDPTRFRATGDFVLAVRPHFQEIARFKAPDGGVLETSIGGKLKIPVQVVRPEKSDYRCKITAPHLPPAFRAAPLDLQGDEGELEISIRNPAQPGTYMFPLMSNIRIDYSHHAELAAAAAAHAKQLAAAAEKAITQAKKAAEARQVAQAEVAARKKKIEPAKAALAQAQHEVAAAKEALQRVVQADAETSSAQQAAETEKQLAACAKKFVSASEKRQAAQQQLADAQRRTAEAEARQSELNQAAQAAADQAKAAAEASKRFQPRATRWERLARNKSIWVPFYSQPLAVKVHPTPIEVKFGDAAPAAAGQAVEIPFHVQRRFGFGGAVTVAANLPGKLAGAKVRSANLPADQSEGKLAIDLPEKAPPGEHRIVVNFKLTFNGQTIASRETVVLRVEKS